MNGAYAYDGPWSLIFDWASAPEFYGSAYSPNMDQFGFQLVHTKCTPSPLPGAYTNWDNWKILEMYDRLMLENRPVSMQLLSPEACPLTGINANTLPDSLNYLSSKNYRLDYLWMDFELPGGAAANDAEVAEAVRQVRAHADPQLNLACIGSYDYYPCSSLAWRPWPDQNTPATVAAANNSYMSTGVNVAMPSLYPYEYYGNHTHSPIWGSNVAPNKRSALFWAPLESFSNAKINLPAGHEIIPFITDFVPHSDPYYDSPKPTREDNVALLQHVRLRGADGYYAFVTDVPSDNEQYRGDMLDAWASLDWLFNGATSVNVLNLETNKTSGVEWSAVETENGVAVVLTNLGNNGYSFDLQTLVDAGMNPDYVDGLYFGYDHYYLNPGDHALLQVPEPTTLGLLTAGVAGLAVRRRR